MQGKAEALSQAESNAGVHRSRLAAIRLSAREGGIATVVSTRVEELREDLARQADGTLGGRSDAGGGSKGRGRG